MSKCQWMNKESFAFDGLELHCHRTYFEPGQRSLLKTEAPEGVTSLAGGLSSCFPIKRYQLFVIWTISLPLFT